MLIGEKNNQRKFVPQDVCKLTLTTATKLAPPTGEPRDALPVSKWKVAINKVSGC